MCINCVFKVYPDTTNYDDSKETIMLHPFRVTQHKRQTYSLFFRKLPLEVRNMIYRHVLTPKSVHVAQAPILAPSVTNSDPPSEESTRNQDWGWHAIPQDVDGVDVSKPTGLFEAMGIWPFIVLTCKQAFAEAFDMWLEFARYTPVFVDLTWTSDQLRQVIDRFATRLGQPIAHTSMSRPPYTFVGHEYEKDSRYKLLAGFGNLTVSLQIPIACVVFERVFLLRFLKIFDGNLRRPDSELCIVVTKRDPSPSSVTDDDFLLGLVEATSFRPIRASVRCISVQVSRRRQEQGHPDSAARAMEVFDATLSGRPVVQSHERRIDVPITYERIVMGSEAQPGSTVGNTIRSWARIWNQERTKIES